MSGNENFTVNFRIKINFYFFILIEVTLRSPRTLRLLNYEIYFEYMFFIFQKIFNTTLSRFNNENRKPVSSLLNYKGFFNTDILC